MKNDDHINKVTADKLKVTPFSAGEKCSLPPDRILLLFVYSAGPAADGLRRNSWEIRHILDSYKKGSF